MGKSSGIRSRASKLTSVMVIAILVLFGITPAASANGGLVLDFPDSSPIDAHVSYQFYLAQIDYAGADGEAIWSISPSDAPFEIESYYQGWRSTMVGSLFFANDVSAGTYNLSISLSVDGSDKGSINLTVNAFDDVLPVTTTPLTGDVGVRPGDRLFASAFERYLSTDLLVDPTDPRLNEYVYRMTTEPNDPATLVDSQSVAGYEVLTEQEQEDWYRNDLGYSSQNPYEFNWGTYICIDDDGNIELPTNMFVEYASVESIVVEGEIDAGLNAAFVSKALMAFFGNSLVGERGNSGVKGDWQMAYGDVIYGVSEVKGDCAADKVLELAVLASYDVHTSKDFVVPSELIGYTAINGDPVRVNSVGATIVVTGLNYFGNAALWGVTQVLEPEQTQTTVVSAPAAAPYVGPVVESVTVASVTSEAAAGDKVTVTGSRLSSVTSVTIDGTSIAITNATDGSFSFLLPESITPGTKDITIVSSSGSHLSQQSLTVALQTLETQEVSAWTKLQPNGTVKVYAKNIVGAGKVQFMVNGEEIAWVRALDETDPKLRFANDAYYLVRTVNLSEGKNALEIYVDGERVRRVAYTLK